MIYATLIAEWLVWILSTASVEYVFFLSEMLFTSSDDGVGLGRIDVCCCDADEIGTRIAASTLYGASQAA